MDRKSNDSPELQELGHILEDQGLKTKSDQTKFLLEKANKAIERRIDEGLRISRCLAEEKTDQPEELRRYEQKRQDRLLQKERRQKKLIAEYLLNLERELNSDISFEREINQRESKKIAQLLSDEQISLELAQADVSHRDQILAIVSHDLRNPLTSIFMGAEVIRMSLENGKLNAGKILKLTEMIERNASVMERMISDLMDIERIAHGKLDIHPQNQTLQSLFRDCEDLFASVAKSRNIRLAFFNKEEFLTAEFDRDRIQQVLANLIGNALKFTPGGGLVSVTAEKANSDLKISVRDTGPGIAMKDQRHIFDRFAQLHAKDRRGLGLGLFISKLIVQAHGGQIWVESDLGKGSTFSLIIPASPSH